MQETLNKMAIGSPFLSKCMPINCKKIVRDLSTPLLIRKPEIRKSEKVNDTTDQLDITNIFRKLHPTTAEWTFISSAHGI